MSILRRKLMKLLSSIERFISSLVSGVPPLSLPDAVSSDVKSLIAYGGTEQNGTPTPSSPVDIVCNNGTIKARHQSGLPLGYTLLEYIQSTGTTSNGQYINTGFVGTINTDIEVKGSDFTNASAQIVVTTATVGGSQLRIAKYTATQKVGADIGTGTPTYSTSNGVSQFVAKLENHNFYLDGQLVGAVSTDGFNQDDMGNILILSGVYETYRYYGIGKIYYVKIWDNNVLVRNFIPAKNSNNVVGMYDLVSNIFFTNQGTGDFIAGNEVNDPIEIYTDGLQETIDVQKNLFNTAGSTYDMAIGQSGVPSSAVYDGHKFAYTDYILVKPNTTYTIAATSVAATATNHRIHSYTSDKVWIQQEANLTLSENTIGQRGTLTFTTGANTYFLRINYVYTPIGENIQMELGSTATSYQPYSTSNTALAEMLLKVGDYQDQQDIINGIVTRRVGVLVLDGTENWDRDNDDIYINKTTLFGYSIPRNSVFLITHFINTYGVNGFGIGNVTFYMNNTGWNTAADFKQYLADQYIAGTPVIVIYPLATETTESVSGQQIRTIEGNNIADIIQASMSGLELSTEYYNIVPIEYLGSTGTQYINTRINPYQDLKVEIKWKNRSAQSSKYLFGSGTNNTNCIRAYIGPSSYWRFGVGAQSIDTNDTIIRTAIFDKEKLTINGTNYSYSDIVEAFSSTTSIKIFAGANGNSPISTNIYYFKIYENNNLILDFIPVRVGSVGYMYDTVSGQLFDNAGTGNFILGPDL